MSTYSTQHIPFVPLAVSVPLVGAAPLAAMLARSAPDLLKVSKSTFEETRINDIKQLEAEEINAEALRQILDLNVLNMQALFAAITNWLQLKGQYVQLIAEAKEQTAATYNRIENRRLQLADADIEVRQIAKDLELPAALFAEDHPIELAALFQACLFRLKYWQQKWEEHCFKTIELDLKSQENAVLSAATDCLNTLCEAGVNDVITIDPTPEEQEDVYLMLYQAIELPFSGAWPKIINVKPATKPTLTSQGES